MAGCAVEHGVKLIHPSRLSYVLILEKIMTVLNESALKKAIANVKKTKEKFRADVQEVLVAVAYQACLGNPNWANELIDALRDTVNLKPATMWLETFAPLMIRKDRFEINKGAAKSMNVKGEADFAEYEAEMRKTNWWEMVAPAKATSIFAPDKYIDGAFERMVKNLNKEGCPDLAKAIEALLPELYSSDAWKKMRDEPERAAVTPDAMTVEGEAIAVEVEHALVADGVVVTLSQAEVVALRNYITMLRAPALNAA